MPAFPILSTAIWLPIVFGLVILAVGTDRKPGVALWVALIGSLLGFAVTIPLVTGFDPTTAALQFQENAVWIDRFNVSYHLGVDGISMWFVVLTALITVIVVAGWEVITDNVSQYLASFLMLSGIMISVFTATDGLLFYVFFEATLIPMYMALLKFEWVKRAAGVRKPTSQNGIFPPLAPPQGGEVLAAGRARGPGGARLCLARALKRARRFLRIKKGSLRRASPALDPEKSTHSKFKRGL
ncbi:MAG: NADH-quinone oxidoreductase subunit M [Burkholderia lata]|uniref:NADH-quinone oxidoreductase subunit M n=1 Tax=Burkholderia lata (strain ATCC 17760 / DSM 23089 / LMG 22485 / NCIMB 9086 / R18194 / 383) TaxID=482957 RepID=A0A833UU44_BURL3|nr:MAG: NADH-quinone oxidoreductase subunit M [Burkholderia lata]